jgi:NADH:ubiquinone oxidoreductase subunit H
MGKRLYLLLSVVGVGARHRGITTLNTILLVENMCQFLRHPWYLCERKFVLLVFCISTLHDCMALPFPSTSSSKLMEHLYLIHIMMTQN